VDTLAIEDGPEIELRGLPAQGTRHRVFFGEIGGAGEKVVVKLEGVPGALENERVALALLGARDTPIPALCASGTAVVRGVRVPLIVIERRRGAAPSTIAGWQRMGRAYARVNSMESPADGLTVLDSVTFGRQHAQRAAELGERLATLTQSVPDWDELVSAEIPGSGPLCVTHGDPGAGNFLDDGHDGAIIDWEEAHIAPRGLDLARLVFIAALGAGPGGYVARDHDARANAALTGYLRAQPDHWRPSPLESRWWMTVAGIQFMHRRWMLRGQPAPWEEAVPVLLELLAVDSAWIAGP
jgi:aminoglycoside phosphotransferase (APT) family kinase protein